ncbi:High mobility group protein B3 [Wickerhamomyces ciferrii]|uniref:High mobility group protein B3 n=1 Tax=Wickerhamomyces ciferrii (strain ATCC 14091 / BCRC 22168 / CBS 111 / JCM 3599 / NBRC 0793 / NRRL Y-1031 F-60-10) TaxID=1206466 RepID=K0KJD0_WICCF|nr:High mobility group protein B3 [Wickerhamomyces ciferrii]CCH43081.1 High mobility group protein B3 [Wickerhamomyces ciferrii]
MLSAFQRLTVTQSAPVLRASFSSTVPAFKDVAATYKGLTTVYSFFISDFYKQNELEFKNKTFAEKNELVSKAWKNLTPSEKLPYEKKHSADKQRYFNEKSAYEATLPPKRPKSTFLAFAADIRDSIVKANPTATQQEIAVLSGKEWNALAESKKQAYKDVYNKELAEWNSKYGKQATA